MVRLLLVFSFTFLWGTDIEESIVKINKRAEDLSSRTRATGLAHHQLTQIWYRGEKRCLGSPIMDKDLGKYVQVVLNKVPENGICIFSDMPVIPEEPGNGWFILDPKTKSLRM